MVSYGDKLWEPSAARASRTRLHAFEEFLVKSGHGPFADYASLHRWSIEDPASFWAAVAAFTEIVWQTSPADALSVYAPPPRGEMRGARWFAGTRLNYAENLLAKSAGHAGPLVVAHAEGAPRRAFSASEWRGAVKAAALGLRARGIVPGDVVAGVVGNLPEALIAMLATAAVGAIWASCSPDFGAEAVVDRLSQVRPKLVFFTENYLYNGKRCNTAVTIATVTQALQGLTNTVCIDHLSPVTTPFGDWAKGFAEFLAEGRADADQAFRFEPRAFHDPLVILFSSGTTGVPKCITHGVGGTLLQHVKELALHGDLGPGTRLLYYTTCGWMMWNWMASALAVGAGLALFEGSVSAPDLGVLWRVAREEGVTHLGTSPKFISSCMHAGISPRSLLEGAGPRTIFSTGSPLLPEHFAWVYAEAGPDLHLASISGGTDIVSCFMLGNPKAAVRAGEIQALGLGMAVEAWDDDEKPVIGAKGELVCTRPFPSMPIYFWNDPDGQKYRQAYFAHFDHDRPGGEKSEVWRHGDYIEITQAGGVIVFGRSDATLNPGGVRIGTAELYRQVEGIAGILDAVAVGEKTADGDECIVLFVKLAAGRPLDDVLRREIRETIRRRLTPRHVPAKIVAVDDIPYTRSGKKVEIAVGQAIRGETVKNLAALVNPECLAGFFAYAKTRA